MLGTLPKYDELVEDARWKKLAELAEKKFGDHHRFLVEYIARTVRQLMREGAYCALIAVQLRQGIAADEYLIRVGADKLSFRRSSFVEGFHLVKFDYSGEYALDDKPVELLWVSSPEEFVVGIRGVARRAKRK